MTDLENLISQKFKFLSIKILDKFLIFLSIYFALFISNIFVNIFNFAEFNKEATLIEKKRVKKDKLLIDKATKEGFIPFLPPKYINKDILAIGGIPFQKYYLCNEGYGLIKFKSDRFGLRNNDKKWSKLEKNSPTTMFIGDSFLQGACVPNENTIPSVFEKLSGENAINLGMISSSPYDYLNTLKYLVEPLMTKDFNVNKVVLVIFANDNIRSDKSIEEIQKINNAQKVVAIVDQQISVEDSYLKNILNSDKNFREFHLNKTVKNKNRLLSMIFLKDLNILMKNRLRLIKNYFYPVRSLPTKKVIKQLKNICNTNCKPIITYIPHSTFWSNFPSSKKYKNNIKTWAKEDDILFIDLEKIINPELRKFYAPKGGHLSKYGYYVVSDQLDKILEN